MFILTGDKIIMELLDTLAETIGGVLLPETLPTRMGVVKAIGPGRWEQGVLIPNATKVGDTVIFIEKFHGKFMIKGRYYDMIEEKNILGYIEGYPEG
jgi:chaperonin GroES